MPDTAYVERDDTIATVILNRPERLNALDLDTVTLLLRHLQELSHDDGVSSIIITGGGRAFCAGGDLGWAAAYPGGPANGLHVLAGHLHQAVLEIHRTGKPVIAAVNGVAAGAGFSLALACDFRVLAETATFRQAYTSAGLSIDGGGTFMLFGDLIENQFLTTGDWNFGSALSLIMMLLILVSLGVLNRVDPGGQAAEGGGLW